MADNATTTTTEIEVKLGDGSVVKGANLEDAFKNLSEMKVNASSAILEKQKLYETEKAEKERIAKELEDTKTALEAAKKPPEKPKQVDEKAFNNDTYFKLLGEDPLKAQDYVDAYRFNLEPDKVRDTFTGMRSRMDQLGQQIDVFTQQSVTASFLAQHPEYPQGDAEAAKKLTDRVNSLINKDGFQYNPSTVEFAFYQLLQSDQIKPLDTTDKGKEKDQDQTPNPALTGAGAVVLDSEIQKAEQMSDKDLFALMQSKGMFR